MDQVIRRLFMLLLGVMLGYCSGFSDAKNHEEMIFVRIVQRVQGFADRTVGEHERAVEQATKEAGR
jgi:hypothetical protein